MAKAEKKKKRKRPDIAPPEDFDDSDIAEMGDDIDLSRVDAMIEDIDDLPVYLKVLDFGEQGSGKTTLIGTFPKPIVLDCNEEGTKSIRGQGHKRVRITSWNDLMTIYWYLKTRKHPFLSVGLDTTTGLADLAMAHVMAEDGHDGLPIKKHWGMMTGMLRNGLILFRNLPMHVVFTAQMRRLDEDDLEEDETKIIVPSLSQAVRNSIGAAVDIIGYSYIKEIEKEVKPGKYKSTFEYRMRIGPHTSILTKVRTEKGVKYPSIIKDPTFDKLFSIVTMKKEDNVNGKERRKGK